MFSFVLWALLLGQNTSVTQAAPRALNNHLREDVEGWIKTGEHQDFPWRIHINKPVLTFQQRMVVKVTATIDAAVLQSQSIKRDLVFIVKVADGTGNWVPDESFVPQRLDASLGRDTNLEMESEVLLKPGKYTIATMVYDSVLNQHNLSLSSISVELLKKDPFPTLFEKAPVAEFVRGEVYGQQVLSSTLPEILVRSRSPIQLDLILDLSTREQQVPIVYYNSPMGGRRSMPPHFRPLNDKTYITSLLQAASVLGALHPEHGCARFSSVDVLKKQDFGPVPTSLLDWHSVFDHELGAGKDTISVSALENRTDLAKYFLSSFKDMTQDAHCAPNAERVVVLLSHGLHLPDGQQKVQADICGCKIYYLRLNDTAMGSDDLKSMLSPLAPKIMDFHDPTQLRKRIAELIEQIQSAAQ